MGRLSGFFSNIYAQLFRIDDTPQRVSIGFGLGIALGVMPFTGPLAAIFFAFVLKVNRASALLGSLITNTWLSIPVFLIAVKTGSALLGIRYTEIYGAWNILVENFRWKALLELSALKIIAPVMLGYMVVSSILGLLGYLAILAIIKLNKKR